MVYSEFKNKHAGATAFIVGKGLSLDRIEHIREKLNADGCIVMALNEGIHKLETLNLTTPLYCVQQDCHLQGDCVPEKDTTVHFMNSWQYTRSDPRSRRVAMSVWSPGAVLYDLPEQAFSAVAALVIAKHMGVKRITFVAFDSWVDEKLGQYAACIGKDSGAVGDPGRHAVNGAWIRQVAKEMFRVVDADLPVVAI